MLYVRFQSSNTHINKLIFYPPFDYSVCTRLDKYIITELPLQIIHTEHIIFNFRCIFVRFNGRVRNIHINMISLSTSKIYAMNTFFFYKYYKNISILYIKQYIYALIYYTRVTYIWLFFFCVLIHIFFFILTFSSSKYVIYFFTNYDLSIR